MTFDNLSSILDGLTTSVFLIDQNRRIVLTNKAASALFGDDLVGLDFVQAVRHPDCLKSIEEVLQGGEKSQTVISLQNPVSATYQVNVVSLEAGESGDGEEAAQAVVSFDNISHIREAEQMRSDFIANVSHELRSPLTTLSGFIETLKGSAKDDPQARARFLDIMEREAQRMSRLIGDLLSLSRVEVDKHVRPTTQVDAVLIVEKVITTLSVQAAKKQMEIRLEKPTSSIAALPGDDDQLTQVFQNLIENAIRYGNPESQVVITVDTLEQAAGMRGQVLAITVQDHGNGIAPEHIARLTERFYRVDNSRSRDMGGTGLGLAIIKHILSRHRGRLQIKSEIGIGSTFTVLLPMSV